MWLSIESLSVRSLNFNILAIDDWKIYTERKTSKAKRSSVYASSKNNFWHITTLNSHIMHMRTCDFSVDLTLFFKWLFWSLSQIPTFWFKIFKCRRTTAGDLFCLAYKLTNHIHSFGWFKSSGCHWSKIPNVQDVIGCHSASSSVLEGAHSSLFRSCWGPCGTGHAQSEKSSNQVNYDEISARTPC